MRVLSFFLLFFVASLRPFAQSNNAISDVWITNGEIKAMVRDGNTLYLGGSFQYVGPSVDFGAALDGTTGQVNASYLRPNGTVWVSVPDGSGGWYIGGEFTSVGCQTRNRLARINSDGSLHDWNPNVTNGVIYTIELSGSTVYVGGTFGGATSQRIGGKYRNRIAALDASTGSATDWDPNANNTVRSIVVSGSVVYVGGDFTTFGPSGSLVTRNRIAALDATLNTGNVISTWNANANAAVYSIKLSGSTVYAAGSFGTIGGQTRSKIAALNVSDGTATTWNPGISNGSVFTLLVTGNTVYVGGTFTTNSSGLVGGQPRNRVAALDATTGLATSWNPDADNNVNAICVGGSTVYVSGTFTTIGGQSRSRIAALDASTGAATSWNPDVRDEVKTLALQSGTVYAGGTFVSIGGAARNNLAAVNILTGQLTSWNPNAGGSIWAMALSGSTLYVGGGFSTIGGQTRNYIAAVNTTDGAVTNWNPSADGQIRSIAVSGSTVYIGGLFSNVGGQARNMIAALDATVETNIVISTWNPGAAVNARALAISGSTLYAGGDFTTIGGQSRKYLAALNASDGTVTSWNPNPSAEVFALAVNGSTIYVGGNFLTFGPTGSTVTRNRLAALSTVTGTPTAWNPSANNTVLSIAVSGSAVYVGGSFSTFSPDGGTSITRNKLAALNINTGIPTGWDPNSGGNINSIAVGSNGVYAGGVFYTMGVVNRRNFASFPITSVDWGGSSGGSWNQASNWAPGIIPNSTLDVAIASGSPLMDVDYTLPAGKTLTLSGTGSLTVSAGKALTIAGTADLGGKSVTFRSDATGTARLAPVTGTLSNATNVTVERYLPLGRKWRLLTAPLTGSSNNSVFYNWQNNDVVSAGRGVEIWGPGGVADPSSSNDGLALGGGASMRSYGSSGWANVTSTNSTLLFDGTTNYGYALFATGPYNNGSTTYIGSPGSLPAAAATTLAATGTLIAGDHTKNFTATSAGQYFLVGNPYASPVDPRSFTATGTVNRTNLNPKLWMWDAKPGVGTGSGLGRYVSFDLSSNTYSVTGNGYADDNVMIQSGQAFFVQAPAIGPATLVFRETSKNANGAHAMMGDEIRTAKSLLRLTLQQSVTTDSTENLDGAVAVFHAEGKAGLDPLDGSKLMNSSENIFFRRENRNLTFEHRPMVTAKDTLQLRMSNLQTRTYRLQVRATDFPEVDGVTAELTDRFTGKSTPISLKGLTDHAFAVTGDSLSTGDRFIIVFSKAAAPGNGTTEPGEVIRMTPYPNPVVSGLPVRVDLEAGRAPWDVQLIDATGRLVWKRTVKDATEMQVRIDMSRMGSGVYQLLMMDGKGQRTVSKVVKNQ
jgi:hypothetical protein